VIEVRLGVTVDDPDTVVADARRAEQLGFDLIGCGEHLFFHGPTPHGLTMLSAAAAATSRIRLVSSITLLPLYAPALVAKMAATVDRISEGRLELGLGSGGEYPPEFAAAGVDPATRFRRTDEGLEVLRRLFTGQSTTFEGRYTTLDGVRLDPPPLQSNGPPIWLGGRKERALRRAGRYADVWLPYMVEPRHVADGLRVVRTEAADSGRDPGTVSAALFVWATVDEDADWARDTGIATVSAAYQQDFRPLADRYLLVGSPSEVVSRITEFRDAGVETVLMQVATGNRDDRQRVLKTLARDVLPNTRDL
jgi:probable F420-dependent oxidoreductase